MNSFDKNQAKDIYLAKWLNGELSDAELKSFVSEEDFAIYVKIKKGIELFESPNFEAKQQQHIEKSIESKKEVKVKKLSYKWIYAAAAVSAILISTYFYTNSNTLRIRTKIGEKHNIALLDGSDVSLNANSSISYKKKSWNKKREVKLQGEAFFKVKKGKSFTVQTKNGSVTVLGTQFNINSQPNYFNVMCYRGRVRVIQNKDTVYLTMGKAYQNNNLKIKKWDFTEENPSWLHGESTYKSTPLKIVIISLENQFGIKIIASKINENQIFTGSFSHDNLNIALKSVFLPVNIQFRIENKKVFLSKK